MQELDDIVLLREYIERDSETAFAALITRHVNKVYSVALRHTNNPQQAEEITQAVFVILARKSRQLGKHVILEGWLYETARLTALTFVRSEIRRARREQEAHMQTVLNKNESDVWPQIVPLLDAALVGLNKTDRHAVVLRFFYGRSLKEIGAALGSSEDTARMRINRALEKLRKFFAHRGVASTGSAIASAISANSVQAAPAGLAMTISAVAAAKGAAASTTTLTLVKGALKIMAWTKTGTILAVGVGVLLAATTTTVTIKEIQDHQNDKWQLGELDINFQRPPYRTVILPTKEAQRSKADGRGGSIVMGNGKSIGIGAPVETIIRRAYAISPGPGQPPQEWDETRTLFLTPPPDGRYDYLSNQPRGAKAALQDEIRKKFSLTAQIETILTNVLLLEVKDPGSNGLKRGDGKTFSTSQGPGGISGSNQSLDKLAEMLEETVNLRIINQTGVRGVFDYDVFWNYNGDPQENLTALNLALGRQLGLELVLTNMPIQMLVVDRAK